MKKQFNIVKLLFTAFIALTAFLGSAALSYAYDRNIENVSTDSNGKVMVKESISGEKVSSDKSFMENVGAVWSNIGDTTAADFAIELIPIYGQYHRAKRLLGYQTETQEVEYCEAETTSCAPYCKYETVESCTLCPMFGVVFNTVNAIGAKAILAFSNSVVRVVIIGFGIWLAIQILAFVASIETKDLKDLMQSILTQGFVVVLVVAILETGVSNFFNSFITPVYTTGQKMAQTMFNDCVSDDDVTLNGDSTKCAPSDKVLTQTESEYIDSEPNNMPGAFSRSMGDSIIQTMTMMENRVRKFKALGSGLMCQSWKDSWFIFPKFIYLFTGLAIWVLSMVIIVGVPFLMIDSVFQLGVAAALLAPAVGCFAFKPTRQYSKKVWETFLNSAFAFLFISVVVLIVLGTIQAAIMKGVASVEESGVVFDELFKPTAAAATKFDEIMKSFQWISPHFFRLVFIFILAWSVMSMAKELADEFASSISSTSIGSAIGTMAASSAKGMALKASKPIASAIGSEIGRGARRAATGLRHMHRRGNLKNASNDMKKVKNNLDDAVKKARASGGRHVDGNTVTTVDSNGNVRQETKNGNKSTVTTVKNGVTTVTEMENGKPVSSRREENGVITETQYDKNGKVKSEIERSEGFTITRKYDKDGNVTSEKMKANTSEADKLLNSEDGSVDKAILDKYTKNMSEEQKKKLMGSLNRKMNKNRMQGKQYSGKIVKEEVIDYNYEQGYIEIRKETDKGDVIFERMQLGNGLAKVTVTVADKDGNVRKMESDGIRNKLSEYKLADGVKTSDMRNGSEFDDNVKDGKVKTSYGYTKYYQEKHDAEEPVPDGFMSEDEIKRCDEFVDTPGNEFQKSEIELVFNKKRIFR